VNRLKQILGLAGIIVALAGLAHDSGVLIWTAIGLLGVSVLLRAVLKVRARRAESEPPSE